eukprot:COSAG02_NODE_56756_length_284_cov_0.491892_1_plen_64_part_01
MYGKHCMQLGTSARDHTRAIPPATTHPPPPACARACPPAGVFPQHGWEPPGLCRGEVPQQGAET